MSNRASYRVLYRAVCAEAARLWNSARRKVTPIPPRAVTAERLEPRQFLSVTASINGVSELNEGSAYALSLSAISTNGPSALGDWKINWGDGSSDSAAPGASVINHVYSQPASSYCVLAEISDGDGPSSASTQVAVDEVTPSLGISGGWTSAGGPSEGPEGSTYFLSTAFLDYVGPGADHVSEWDIYWGDGSSDVIGAGSASPAVGDAETFTHVYSEAGCESVTVNAVVVTEGSCSYCLSGGTDATVDAVAPTVLASGPEAVSSGSTYELDVLFDHVNLHTAQTWIIDWGDGSTDFCSAGGNSNAFDHVYSADGVYSISVHAFDDENPYDAGDPNVASGYPATAAVFVGGPVTADYSSQVAEGVSATVSGAYCDIAGNAPSGWELDWGDGTSDSCTTVQACDPETFWMNFSHLYSEAGCYNATLTVYDGDGTFSTPLSIQQYAPAAGVYGANSVDRDSSYVVYDTFSGDAPSQSVDHWCVDWGDGATDTYTGDPGSFSHAYSDAGSYTATATVFDDVGASSSSSINVDVNEVAASGAWVDGACTVNKNAEYDLFGGVSDPLGLPTSDWTWTVIWGDGSSNTYDDSSLGFSHYYESQGDYSITMSAAETDREVGASAAVSVCDTTPDVEASSAGPAYAGASYEIDGSFTDAGGEAPSSWALFWGDGSSDTSPGYGSSTGSRGTPGCGSATFDHSYSAPGEYSATLVASGAKGSYSSSINVEVNLPAMELTGSSSAQEHADYSLAVSFAPAGAVPDGYWIDWGEGCCGTADGSDYSFDHTYIHAGNYTVTVNADIGGYCESSSMAVEVDEGTPWLSVGTAGSAVQGSDAVLDAGFAYEDGTGASSWTVEWGDEASDTYCESGSAASFDHVYSEAGSFSATVTAYDAEGYSFGSSAEVDVQEMPSNVTNLTAIAPSSSEIDLSWTNNASAATSIEIDRSSDGSTYGELAILPASDTSYADTGLGDDARFYYRMQVIEGAISSPWVYVDTSTRPAAPTAVNADPGDTQTFLSWTATTATSYNIYQYNGGAYVHIASTTSSNYTITGLTNGSDYSYEVSALNSGGESTLSGAASVTPAAQTVEFLKANAASTGEINLTWNLNTIGAQSIEVDRSIDGSSYSAVTTTLPGTAVSYSDTGLAENTHYHYKVRAIYPDDSTSDFSRPADAYTLPAITGFAATPASATEVNLSWTPNISNAVDIEIERSTDGTTFTTLTNTLDPATTSYSDTGLSESTHYYYRIHAITALGESEETATADTTTRAAVDNFSASGGTIGEIDLGWNLNVADATGVEIDRSADGGTTWSTLATLAASDTTYADTGLADNANYNYRVRAIRPSGDSAYSAPVDATTTAVIEGLSATQGIFGGVNLAWTLNATDATLLSIYRSTDGGNYDFLTDSDLSTAITPTSTSFFDYGVSEGHVYSYKLQATLPGGNSNFSTPADVSTMPIQNLNYAPGATAMTLNWSNTSPDATAIEIDQSTDGTTYTALTTSLDGSAMTYTATGLSENTQYWYKVSITDSSGTTMLEPLIIWTLPSAPTDLAVTSATPGEVDLSWTNPGLSTTPFFIERSDDGGATYAVVDMTAAGATAYQDVTVTDGTNYTYRVSAASLDGFNGNPTTATVSIIVPVAAPTELTARPNGQNEIDLSWNNASQTATGYIIERSTDGESFEEVGTVANADDSSYSDTGLTAGTQYYYRVRATNASSDQSGPSNIATTVTAPDISLCDSNATTVYEGDTYTLYTSNLFATGEIDPVKGWTVNWGDGTTTNVAGIANGDPGSFTHAYTSTGLYSITANTIDGSFTGTEVVEATYDFATVDSRITLTSTSATNPTAGTAFSMTAQYADPAGHHVNSWVVNWGDGTIETFSGSDSSTYGTADNPASTDTKTFTHTYPDAIIFEHNVVITAVTSENVYQYSPGYYVTGNVSWSSDNITAGTASTDPAAYPTPVDGIADAVADAPSAPPGTFTVDWGDGSAATTYHSSDGNNISPAHEYATQGSYLIVITEHTDDDRDLIGHGIMNIVPAATVMPELADQVVSEGGALSGSETVTNTSSDPLFATILFGSERAPEVVGLSSGTVDLTGVDAPSYLVGSEATDGVGTKISVYNATVAATPTSKDFTIDF